MPLLAVLDHRALSKTFLLNLYLGKLEVKPLRAFSQLLHSVNSATLILRWWYGVWCEVLVGFASMLDSTC